LAALITKCSAKDETIFVVSASKALSYRLHVVPRQLKLEFGPAVQNFLDNRYSVN